MNETSCETNQLINDDCPGNVSLTSSLFLSNCLLVLSSIESFPNEPTETIDIFSYCKGGSNSLLFDKTWYIRFDPKIYPVPFDLDKSFIKESVGLKLVAEIQKKIEDGNECKFISNGGGKQKLNIRNLRCSRFRLSTVDNDFGNDNQTLSNVILRRKNKNRMMDNKGNNNPLPCPQNDGTFKKKMQSHNNSKSTRAGTLKDLCNANISIKVDKISFYIQCQTGNCIHSKHPKIKPTLLNIKENRCKPLKGVHGSKIIYTDTNDCAVLDYDSDTYDNDISNENYACEVATSNATFTQKESNEQKRSQDIFMPMFKEIIAMMQHAPLDVFIKHKQAICDIVLQLKNDLNTDPTTKHKTISNAALYYNNMNVAKKCNNKKQKIDFTGNL